jgi:uncharacterized C2H2 Zn-finger protein
VAEVHVATLRCPKCDSTLSAGDGWAKTAVAMLMPAPAVPDMASVVRCPKCRHVFTDAEIRYLGAARPYTSNAVLLGVVVAALVVVLLRSFVS